MTWKHSIVLAIIALGVGARPLLAADDPTIKGELRSEIRATMAKYVEDHTVDGIFWHYDPVENALLELTFKELHAGIVRKGPFYVSCADFVDQDGRTLDVDLLMVAVNEGPSPSLTILHKIDGEKRPYSVEREDTPVKP